MHMAVKRLLTPSVRLYPYHIIKDKVLSGSPIIVINKAVSICIMIKQLFCYVNFEAVRVSFFKGDFVIL